MTAGRQLKSQPDSSDRCVGSDRPESVHTVSDGGGGEDVERSPLI